jgi:hypothetical protein
MIKEALEKLEEKKLVSINGVTVTFKRIGYDQNRYDTLHMNSYVWGNQNKYYKDLFYKNNKLKIDDEYKIKLESKKLKIPRKLNCYDVNMWRVCSKIFPFHILKSLFEIESNETVQYPKPIDHAISNIFDTHFKSLINRYALKSGEYLNQVEDHINEFKTSMKGDEDTS